MASIAAEPLLTRRQAAGDPLPGLVDHRGGAAYPSATGSWSSAVFIIGVEIAERFAYYGISSNLISYLTGPLGQSTATAAAAVNAWSGVASMLPLIGAFIADSYVGRYHTIIIASLFYLLGLGLLTLSSMLPSTWTHECGGFSAPCPQSQFQVVMFYFSLYLVAFAQGGHKPCTQAFGADQFNENDPEECKSKSSFFNWWYFGMCFGTMVTLIVLSYVQDNISWSLGFGIPCIVMGLGLIMFLAGTRTYRYYILKDESPFIRIGKGLIKLITRKGSQSAYSMVSDDCSLKEYIYVESADEVEAREFINVFPIWLTCLIYGVVFAQSSTFFTKQGSTLDRRIGSNFQAPPAALQSFISFTIVVFIPIYDRVLVPVARKITKTPTGITMLQRIGSGMFLSLVSIILSALVEMKRLKTARDYGLIDSPDATIPMSLWWMVPQYVLYGVSDVFAMVGLQEFFYDQMPDALRSLGLALYLSIFGLGSFISSFLVSFIDGYTIKNGGSWFSTNLNRAHLDYFYWLLAGLSAVELVLYIYFAQAYRYKKKANILVSDI